MKKTILARLRRAAFGGFQLWLACVPTLSTASNLTAAPHSLTWQAAIAEAARNNAELKAAQANLQAAQANVQVARSTYLPTVNATFSAGVNGNDSSGGGDASSFTEAQGKVKNSYSASLEANETIFDGFATQSRVAQSQGKVQEAEQQLQVLKARLSYDLKTAYASMMQAQKTLRLYQDIIKRREENLRLVELRFAGGQENKGAVRLSEAYMKQARFEELQARDALRVARAKLNGVLGRGDDNSYELKNDVPIAEIPGLVDFAALARLTPDYRLSVAQETTATASLSLARAGYYPSVGVRGSIGRRDDTFFPENETWSVALTLTVPIFSGGRDYYTKEAAVQQLTAATLGRDTSERNLIARLHKAHADLQESAEKLKVDESFQEAVTLRAEIARSKYNNGLTTFDDWDLIENDLISRQRAVISSQGNRVNTEAAWEQAQGKGVWQ